MCRLPPSSAHASARPAKACVIVALTYITSFSVHFLFREEDTASPQEWLIEFGRRAEGKRSHDSLAVGSRRNPLHETTQIIQQGRHSISPGLFTVELQFDRQTFDFISFHTAYPQQIRA